MAARDRNAALAGLAALGALMYARSRKAEEETPAPEFKPPKAPTTRTEPDITPEYLRSLDVPTEPGLGASASPMGPAGPAAPTRPMAPSMGAGPAAPTRPMAPSMGAGTGRGGQGGPTAAQLAAARPVAADIRKADTAAEQRQLAERQRRLATPGSDAIQSDTDILSPLPGLSRFGALAKTLASKGTSVIPRALDEAKLTFLGRSGAKNVTPAERIGTTQRPLLEGPKSADRVTGAPGPKTLPSPGAARRVMDEEEMMSMPMKRGGKAKAKVKKMASGGMARSSSASSRADGIAKRGKTRGRMY